MTGRAAGPRTPPRYDPPVHTRVRRLPLVLGALVLLLTAWAAVGDRPPTAPGHGTAPTLGAVHDGTAAVQPVRDAVVMPFVAAARSASSGSAAPGTIAALAALLALAGWRRIELGRPTLAPTPRRDAFAALRAPPTGPAA